MRIDLVFLGRNDRRGGRDDDVRRVLGADTHQTGDSGGDDP